MSRQLSHSFLVYVSTFALFGSLPGCSSDSRAGAGPDGGSAATPNVGTGGGGVGSGSGGTGAGAAGSAGDSAGLLEGVDGRGGDSGNGSEVTPVLPGSECTGEAFSGEAIPLEIYIMMDRSVSMGDARPEYLLPGGGRKWDAVRNGFEDFFALPAVQTTSAGIDFFNQGSCDPDDYSTPEVAIAPVPTVADDILANYDTWSPGGNTPLGPALEGALIHARRWKMDHPGTEVAVVLVTDGVPNGCGTMTSDPRGGADSVAPIAAEYANGTPPVPTYVLGIEGIEVSAEDFRYVVTEIATAGGTEPVIVQATDDLAKKFASGLETIHSSAAPPCSYSVPLPPPGDTLDLSRVNVVLEPVNSGPEAILNVTGADDCEYGGWYYDPPADPQSIQLCPNTCDTVSQLNGAGFKVLFGCNTVSRVR